MGPQGNKLKKVRVNGMTRLKIICEWNFNWLVVKNNFVFALSNVARIEVHRHIIRNMFSNKHFSA